MIVINDHHPCSKKNTSSNFVVEHLQQTTSLKNRSTSPTFKKATPEFSFAMKTSIKNQQTAPLKCANRFINNHFKHTGFIHMQSIIGNKKCMQKRFLVTSNTTCHHEKHNNNCQAPLFFNNFTFLKEEGKIQRKIDACDESLCFIKELCKPLKPSIIRKTKDMANIKNR